MTETTRTASTPRADPATRSEAYPSRRALAWFSLVRVCVALGLLLVYAPTPAELWRAGGPLPLTAWVVLIYAPLVLVGTLSQYFRWPPNDQQVQLSVFLDIVAFTLLMHASGGTRSAPGLLLAITVASGSLLMAGRLSLLFASFATLGVIAQETYAQLYLGATADSLTRAGLLGITFFAVALLGHVLYRRILETEQLAARRQVDIDDLSKLNEFIIQNMSTGVLVVDRNQRLRLVNGAALRLLGLRRFARGEPLQEVAPKLAVWLDARRRDREAPDEADSVMVREQEIKPTPRPFGKGAGAGTLVFLRDNRELVRRAQEIKLASLGRLTASIAHNIRNPLSSISHAGQLLAEAPALSDQDRNLLDIIRRNSGRIDDIIESVLQLSRRRQPAREPMELGTWLEEFCTELRVTRGLSQQRLRFLRPQADLVVKVDPRHLHQILSNLCDNALKHAGNTREPVRIEIRARPDPVRGDPTIEVKDEGPGIEPAVAREIFTPFFSTSPSGTGLGLYIAKELSEANGAKLKYIESEHPGTCFRLSFPT